MVGLKAKGSASAYFAKSGWIRGCIFVDGVCVCGGGVYWGGVCVCVCVCVCEGGYGWGGWGVLEGWECIGRRGKWNNTIISYLLH